MWTFDYESPSAINLLLEAQGLAMSKKFGQNFLVDNTARRRLAELIPSGEKAVIWEIGPGIGSLSEKLINSGAALTVFEIDKGFCRILEEFAFADEIASGRLTLVKGDALKTLPKYAHKAQKPDCICGNLPYNVGSVIIADILERQLGAQTMVFTLQKEVTQRLAAKPGDKLWSSFTILARIDYEVSVPLNLSPSCFWPQPNVSSAVIVMKRREKSLITDELRSTFLRVSKGLFAQRRKTVKNNLARLIGTDQAAAALEKAGINPNERAENLSVEQIKSIAESI